jgi:hypothetical protein
MERIYVLTWFVIALGANVGIARIACAEQAQEFVNALGQTRTFDVYYSVFTTVHLRKQGDQPLYGESYLRFVLDASGRQRVERYQNESGLMMDIGVYDGTTFCSLSLPNRLAIRARDIDSDPILRYGESYCELLDGLFGGGDLRKLISKRSEVKASESEDGVQIDIPPEAGEMYPKFGWRVFLAAHHGLVPIRRERFLKNMETLVQTTKITAFHELDDEKFVPVEATLEYFGAGGTKVQTIRIVVDVDKSAWNHVPNKVSFKVAIPKGTIVIDDVRGLRYTASSDSDSSQLDELAKNGTQKIDITNRANGPSKSRAND